MTRRPQDEMQTGERGSAVTHSPAPLHQRGLSANWQAFLLPSAQFPGEESRSHLRAQPPQHADSFLIE